MLSLLFRDMSFVLISVQPANSKLYVCDRDKNTIHVVLPLISERSACKSRVKSAVRMTEGQAPAASPSAPLLPQSRWNLVQFGLACSYTMGIVAMWKFPYLVYKHTGKSDSSASICCCNIHGPRQNRQFSQIGNADVCVNMDI